MLQHTSIHQWPETERPREKLLQQGATVLSDAELLAILIRNGTPGRSALDIGREILLHFKTFRAMTEAPLSDWKTFHGLGPAKLAQIKAALEIGRRFRAHEVRVERPTIRSSADIVEMMMPLLRDRKTEAFRTVYLDAKNRVITIADSAEGTVTSATPFIREIIRHALERGAARMIGIHNHPSGDPTPSVNDQVFTDELSRAAKIMQIKFLDHIIIGDNKHYSFADEGRL